VIHHVAHAERFLAAELGAVLAGACLWRRRAF